ncbi:MAG: SIR2 family protein, partial [Prosthecobacter sp.]|nr:SIR2 family protein [Prosthecobacter sp.]
ENRTYSQSTFYDEVRAELERTDHPSFPDLMTAYCELPDGRIRLLQKIKSRIDYFLSFDDLYRPMARFHRSVAPLFMITDIITTNWDDLFEQECKFSPFIYDADLAFWDAAKRRVMKIHGSISNFGSIIATASDYKKSYERLNDGPLGAQLKSLIARKTVVYVGYSLSDENYLRLLRNIATMMDGNLRQSYFIAPTIDESKLKEAPIPLLPIETDGAYFFEQVREQLKETCGIIRDEAFRECELLLDDVAELHIKTADVFVKTQNPILIFILSYQDGLIHALKRIRRMEKTGEYSSLASVHSLMHNYDIKIYHYSKKKDYWNASYARGYQNGLMFLLLNAQDEEFRGPPFFEAPFNVEVRSLSAARKFPANKLPRAVLAQAKRILRRLPKDAELIPDHSPFL